MKRRFLLLAISSLLLIPSNVVAQTQDLPKFEIAGEFSTLERDGFGNKQTEPGVGARFTFNFNRSLAFETAGYFFPRQCNLCRNEGSVSQVVAGAKIGKRFEKWGIFAKARPGVVSFSRGEFNPILITPTGPIAIQTNRITSFATDFGGVLEFYPLPRIVTRFDVGDTIIHFRRRTTNGVIFNPTTGEFDLFPFVRPARTTHNFQFTAGVGFRF
ncbi:MAG TPA: hypothetical protein VFO99_13980 [Pyrinomonadaceae bacterium]|nr:hypothetical protein [Pyrinomonadaceae bacterium]